MRQYRPSAMRQQKSRKRAPGTEPGADYESVFNHYSNVANDGGYFQIALLALNFFRKGKAV